MSKVFGLISEEIKCRAIEAIRSADSDEYVVFKKKTRSLEQNSKFHAICQELSSLGIKLNGRMFTPTEWKSLLISGHALASGADQVAICGIEGEVIMLRESSAQMTVSRMNSLIEYCTAFLETQRPTDATSKI